MNTSKREKTIIRLEALAILQSRRSAASKPSESLISRYEMKNLLQLSNYKQLHDIMNYLIDRNFVGTSDDNQGGSDDRVVVSYFILDKGTEFFLTVGKEFLSQFLDFDFTL